MQFYVANTRNLSHNHVGGMLASGTGEQHITISTPVSATLTASSLVGRVGLCVRTNGPRKQRWFIGEHGGNLFSASLS